MTLEIRDLAFAYEEESILEGIDLTAEEGELLGLLGPNGSGKSTLLQTINRILEPDRGTVRVDGDRLSAMSRTEIARQIGYVPQEETSAFPASVFETVLQGRRPQGGWSPSESDRQAATAMIDRLDLEAFTNRRVSDLSGGQRQKVRLGRALVGDPSVLLLDEPTSDLDLKNKLGVMDMIVEHVREEAVAGMVAMHDLNLAARYCDRIALLYEEDIFDVGGPDVLTSETIRTVYDVEATIRRHGDRRLVVPEAAVGGKLPSTGDLTARPTADDD